MATLAPGGRITTSVVDEEIARLTRIWQPKTTSQNHELLAGLLGEDYAENIDMFTETQLSKVVEVCKESKSLADAGRKLFSVSRQQRAKTNDSDRLRKYLQKFDLSWKDLTGY